MSAPLDVTPLFIRCGSVIPVADPRVMTVNNATNSSVMTWQNLKVFQQNRVHTIVLSDIKGQFYWGCKNSCQKCQRLRNYF